MGSMAAWMGFPGGAMYTATKAALGNYTNALRREVAPLGIAVTTIEPGAFLTGAYAADRVSFTTNQIEGMKAILGPATAAVQKLQEGARGDPVKFAGLIVEALTGTGRCEERSLPARLVVGADAVPLVRRVLEENRKSLEDWAELGCSTDRDDFVEDAER